MASLRFAKLAFVPYCWASSFGFSVGLVGDRLSVHMIPHGNVNLLYLAELLRAVPSFVRLCSVKASRIAIRFASRRGSWAFAKQSADTSTGMQLGLGITRHGPCNKRREGRSRSRIAAIDAVPQLSQGFCCVQTLPERAPPSQRE